MDILIFKYAVSMGVYFALLLILIDVMKKYYKFATYFWIATLFTIPLWFITLDGWFRWVKTLSVIFPIILGGFIRIADQERHRTGGVWNFLRKDWVVWFVYGILFLNIAEATLKDVALGNLGNALCGLLLCVTIPFPNGRKYFKLSETDKSTFIAYTTVAWNFLYTTWNLCFVYGESPAYFASSFCILMAAEIYPIIKRRPELYITARIYTLAAHLIIRACFPNLFLNVMNSSAWFNPEVLYYWGLANGILIIPYTFWYVWQIHTGRAEVTFFRGKSHSAAG